MNIYLDKHPMLPRPQSCTLSSILMLNYVDLVFTSVRVAMWNRLNVDYNVVISIFLCYCFLNYSTRWVRWYYLHGVKSDTTFKKIENVL